MIMRVKFCAQIPKARNFASSIIAIYQSDCARKRNPSIAVINALASATIQSAASAPSGTAMATQRKCRRTNGIRNLSATTTPTCIPFSMTCHPSSHVSIPQRLRPTSERPLKVISNQVRSICSPPPRPWKWASTSATLKASSYAMHHPTSRIINNAPVVQDDALKQHRSVSPTPAIDATIRMSSSIPKISSAKSHAHRTFT